MSRRVYSQRGGDRLLSIEAFEPAPKNAHQAALSERSPQSGRFSRSAISLARALAALFSRKRAKLITGISRSSI